MKNYRQKVIEHLAREKELEEIIEPIEEVEEVTDEMIMPDIEAVEDTPNLTFELRPFIQRWAKNMLDYARDFQNERTPKKDGLKQAVKEMNDNIKSGALKSIEAKRIRDESFEMAEKMDIRYMRGIKDQLKREGLFPDFN